MRAHGHPPSHHCPPFHAQSSRAHTIYSQSRVIGNYTPTKQPPTARLSEKLPSTPSKTTDFYRAGLNQVIFLSSSQVLRWPSPLGAPRHVLYLASLRAHSFCTADSGLGFFYDRLGLCIASARKNGAVMYAAAVCEHHSSLMGAILVDHATSRGCPSFCANHQ